VTLRIYLFRPIPISPAFPQFTNGACQRNLHNLEGEAPASYVDTRRLFARSEMTDLGKEAIALAQLLLFDIDAG
jgi:hypothetical protein